MNEESLYTLLLFSPSGSPLQTPVHLTSDHLNSQVDKKLNYWAVFFIFSSFSNTRKSKDNEKNNLTLEVVGEGKTLLKSPIYAPLVLPINYLKLQSL